MVKRHDTFAEIQPTYLFVEIDKRKKALVKQCPDAKLISLGIGDTTEPLQNTVVDGIIEKVRALNTVEGYTGYGDYNGSETLRKALSKLVYKSVISEDEIFISDGSKPDLARLQFLFGDDVTVAVQDPVYPVYVDASVISGKGGKYCSTTGRYTKILYMECQPENNFFPDLDSIKGADIIYICSPNNPTGAVMSKDQLLSIVQFAKQNKKIIIYDAAYSQYIRNTEMYPQSIFEIEGAREVAIETNSFSKTLGFTGVRLGWTAVSKDLLFDDGTPVIRDWSRIMGTFFNGPPNLSEAGAIAALGKGLQCVKEMTDFYLENAKIIRSVLSGTGLKFYGGVDSPYIWVQVPAGKSSWDVFQVLLDGSHVVVTPGEGFGRGGKSFIRISSFAHRADVEEAMQRIAKYFETESK